MLPKSKDTRWKIITNQLRNKYRLVILNDDSFAETLSVRLSPLGLIILIGAVTIVMTSFVIAIVAFTPLREYIPGYGYMGDKKELVLLSAKADSLENTLNARDWYMNNLLQVFSGKTEGRPAKPVRDSTGKYKKIDIDPGQHDIALRTNIESNQVQSTSSKVSASKPNGISNFLFFSPVQGIITTSYNLNESHFGVDIVTKENELVKSTLDGTVVFVGLTSEDGYVVQIQHSHNITSIYKHNASIIKKTGDYVKAGEPIALVGNTGENSKGPHVHFELWYNGFAIDPQDYVVF